MSEKIINMPQTGDEENDPVWSGGDENDLAVSEANVEAILNRPEERGNFI